MPNQSTNHAYTFQVVLFSEQTNALMFQHVVKDAILNKGTSVLFKKSLSRADFYRSSYILYVTDMTVYKSGQPRLELNLDISSSIVRPNPNSSPQFKIINLWFKTDHTTLNPNRRRIEMPLPPLNELTISFNQIKMVN